MTLVRKRFQPVEGASDLPKGPGLAAPVCHAVTGDAVFLEDVQGATGVTFRCGATTRGVAGRSGAL